MRYIITLALTATPALADVPSVVTDIPPVHALVAQVMGDLGQPALLLAKGADEHDFQLKPSQAGAVADAGLVVWIGPELTPWLDSALETRPEGAAALALLRAEGVALRDYAAGGEAEHDHAEEAHDHEAEGHDHEAEEGHDHDKAEAGHADDHAGHAHDGTDPHAWLDPGNASVWLGLIAAELARLDPENAGVYQANAATAQTGVAALEAEVAAMLAPVQGKPLVTFHDAFGYFADHFGLTMAGSIALGDAASPGAARLSELRATMEAGEVLCIFPEVQHDPALVTQLAEGTGARIGGALDPVGSSLEPGPRAYAALLTGMAQVMADCVGS
jgi:zinc transport system substrate-binding protein